MKRNKTSDAEYTDTTKRRPLKSTLSEDPIEQEEHLRERMQRTREFTASEGRLGDSEQDLNDLPESKRKRTNRYDPALSAGEENRRKNEHFQRQRIVSRDKVGMAYGKDRYIDRDKDNS